MLFNFEGKDYWIVLWYPLQMLLDTQPQGWLFLLLLFWEERRSHRIPFFLSSYLFPVSAISFLNGHNCWPIPLTFALFIVWAETRYCLLPDVWKLWDVQSGSTSRGFLHILSFNFVPGPQFQATDGFWTEFNYDAYSLCLLPHGTTMESFSVSLSLRLFLLGSPVAAWTWSRSLSASTILKNAWWHVAGMEEGWWAKHARPCQLTWTPSFLRLLLLPHQYSLASAPPGPAHHASLGAASASFIAPGKDGFVPCVPTKKMIPRIILAHEKSCSGCSLFGPGF